jgi:ribosome-interacting GTPase 1
MGMPNAGKSALVEALTQAKVTVAPFPFSTHVPVPGMMPYEDIQIQLVDMPPFLEDGMPPGMMGAVRSADMILLCVDLAALDLLEQTEEALAVFAERGLVPAGMAPPEGCEEGPIILLGTKCDVPGAEDNGDVLAELRPDLPPLLHCSAESGEDLAELKQICFERLDIVRVYSKLPGKDPDMNEPFTLPRGSTVVDFATAVHRDFADTLRYARVWGSARFDGQSVQHDHPLEDRDVVELHT